MLISYMLSTIFNLHFLYVFPFKGVHVAVKLPKNSALNSGQCMKQRTNLESITIESVLQLQLQLNKLSACQRLQLLAQLSKRVGVNWIFR